MLSVHVRAEEEEERATGGRGNAKERAAARAAARKGVLSLRLYAACTATAAGLPAGSVTLLALNLRSEPVAFPVGVRVRVRVRDRVRAGRAHRIRHTA